MSRIAWRIYERLHWQDRKTMGDQFISATDSIGANVAEGYARYHFLDKIKFYYNARGSFSEANDHWLEILKERKKTEETDYIKYKNMANNFSIKLQNFIKIHYNARNNKIQ